MKVTVTDDEGIDTVLTNEVEAEEETTEETPEVAVPQETDTVA